MTGGETPVDFPAGLKIIVRGKERGHESDLGMVVVHGGCRREGTKVGGDGGRRVVVGFR